MGVGGHDWSSLCTRIKLSDNNNNNKTRGLEVILLKSNIPYIFSNERVLIKTTGTKVCIATKAQSTTIWRQSHARHREPNKTNWETPRHRACFPKCIHWNSTHHGVYSGMPATGMSSHHEGRVPTKDIPDLIKKTRVCLVSMRTLSSNLRTRSKGWCGGTCFQSQSWEAR